MLRRQETVADGNWMPDTHCPLGCHGNRRRRGIPLAGAVRESGLLRVDRQLVRRRKSTTEQRDEMVEVVLRRSQLETDDVTVSLQSTHLDRSDNDQHHPVALLASD